MKPQRKYEKHVSGRKMLSFIRGFQSFSTDAREMYSKTKYFGGFRNKEAILKKMLPFTQAFSKTNIL